MEELWRLAQDTARREAQAALGAERELLQTQQNQLSDDRNTLARESAALTERDTLRNAALARAQGQADELTTQLRDLQSTLQQRDGELASVRVSLARAVEAKDAAQYEHQRSIQTLTEERKRQEERFSANERRHLDEIDRARQEAKYSARLLREAIETHKGSRQEFEAVQTKLHERIHSAEIELATMRVRIQASELLVAELRKATHTNAHQGLVKKRLHGGAPSKRKTPLAKHS